MKVTQVYIPFLTALAVFSSALFAANPIHSIKITNGASFEVIPKDGRSAFGFINAYGLSERMKPAMRERARPAIEAADYAVGLQIRTKDAKAAIQQILAQVSAQSGRSLITVHNSNLQDIEPTVMLMALDADSVWFLVLSQRESSEVYSVSCAYLIDEKKG